MRLPSGPWTPGPLARYNPLMQVGAVTRWVLSEQLRNPFFLLVLVLAMASWPALAQLTPLGITTRDRSHDGPLYELAFIVLLSGALFGMAALARNRWFLEPLPTLRRLAVETWCLVCSTGPLLAALFCFPLLGGVQSAFWWQLAPRLLIASLHLLALVLVLQRLPLTVASRLWALPTLVWLLPALITPHSDLGSALHPVLAVASHLGPPDQSVLVGTEWKVALRPIIGLLAIALLLALPSKSRHALRHPG